MTKVKVSQENRLQVSGNRQMAYVDEVAQRYKKRKWYMKAVIQALMIPQNKGTGHLRIERKVNARKITCVLQAVTEVVEPSALDCIPHQPQGMRLDTGYVLSPGHNSTRQSSAIRNDFARSRASWILWSWSHMARHRATWHANQVTWKGRRESSSPEGSPRCINDCLTLWATCC